MNAIAAMRQAHSDKRAAAYNVKVAASQRTLARLTELDKTLHRDPRSGVPTIKNQLDELAFYGKPFVPCTHTWRRHDKVLKQCTTCLLYIGRRLRHHDTLSSLLPLLHSKILPPTDGRGKYYNDCIVNKYLRVQRVMLLANIHGYEMEHFWLSVRFPKGWLRTVRFTEMQFDRVIRSVDKVLTSRDPATIYRTAQIAIYGRCYALP